MQRIYLFDVEYIQWRLEAAVYEAMEQTGLFDEIHEKRKLMLYDIHRWWFMDRLDRICLFPIVNDDKPVLPQIFADCVLRQARDLESILYRAICCPKGDANGDWTQAYIRLLPTELVVCVRGG